MKIDAETIGAIIGGIVGIAAFIGILWAILEAAFKRNKR